MGLRNVLRFFPLLFLLFGASARGENAAFDLAGPSLDVWVQRSGKTLPIAEVPNLRTGDRIRVHAALPENQAVHYLLVAVFLRGATNPPPEKWFTRMETWRKKTRDEGIVIPVPEGAEQAAIFLAPETSGDFATLRSAVRGRPGAFVRAIQDLQQASLDRSRLDIYLAAVHRAAEEDPAKLRDKTVLLARSLNLRLDEDCYKKHTEEQEACLTQRSENLVLNDGHSRSMVGALTQGPASDLIGQITYTPTAGSGYFSPYVGAIVDMARILDSLHTAQYQYIPALGLPRKDQLRLKLNTPPSFHNPKSVIVVALPPVKIAEPPPFRALDPEQATCLRDAPLVVPVAGAPLAFSTELLHDLVLRVESGGSAVELPARANAARGGFEIDTKGLAGTAAEKQGGEGVLKGFWGFDAFTGPRFRLQSARTTAWSIPAAQTADLAAGHEHTFTLRGEGAACVRQVSLRTEKGSEAKAAWKALKPNELEVKVPAAGAVAGTLRIGVKQEGMAAADEVKVSLYAETATLERLVVIPGVRQAILHGKHLEGVERVEVKGVRFWPAKPAGAQAEEWPFLAESEGATAGWKPTESGEKGKAVLRDGRKVETAVVVESPRPSVTLLSKQVRAGAASAASSIRLTNEDELPLDGTLAFSLKAAMPGVFGRGEKIEVATADLGLRATLGIGDGGVTLQDPRTAVATLEPLKSLGRSAFGPLRFRPVDERGVAGDWQPLAVLVRVPALRELRCPEDVTEACVLSGTNLFLLESVAVDADFASAATVPEGFVENTLRVPRPPAAADGTEAGTAGSAVTLYVKLRDDPKVVNVATVPVGAMAAAQ